MSVCCRLQIVLLIWAAKSALIASSIQTDISIMPRVVNNLPSVMDEVNLHSIWQAIQQIKVDMTAHFDKKKIETIQAGLNTIQGSLSTMCDQILEI